MNKKFRFILTVFSLFIINMASEGADDGEWKVVGKSKKTIEDKINFENIQNVKEVANNILQIRSSKTQLEFGIDNITRDHSKSSHIHLKSYFTTDDRDTIKNLIIQTIDEPEDFKSYYIESRGGIKHRLALSKTFQYPIGYDEQNSEPIHCSSPLPLQLMPDLALH